MRVVLDEDEAAGLSDACHAVRVRADPRIMDGADRAGPGRDCRFDSTGVEPERVRIHVDKNGT